MVFSLLLPVLFAAISVAIASLTFTATTVTGDVAFTIASTTFSGGNVGISTTTPQYVLDLQGNERIIGSQTATSTLYLQAAAGQTANLLDIVSSTISTEFLAVSSSGQVMVGTSTPAASNAILTIVSTTNIMTVLSNGRVGVGTTNPSSTLDVAGTTNLRGVAANTGLYVNSSGNVGIGTTNDTPFSGLSAFRTSIANAGNGLVLPLTGIGSSATNIIQINDSAYGGTLLRMQATRAANSAFNFLNVSAGANGTTGADGTSVFFIRGDGNVGIGTTAPTALFYVNGSSTFANHTSSTGTIPSVGTCGTSPSIVGTDNASFVTVGAGAVQSCTLTFATAFKSPPVCTITNTNTSTAITYQASSTATVLTFSSSQTMAQVKFAVICLGID